MMIGLAKMIENKIVEIIGGITFRSEPFTLMEISFMGEIINNGRFDGTKKANILIDYALPQLKLITRLIEDGRIRLNDQYLYKKISNDVAFNALALIKCFTQDAQIKINAKHLTHRRRFKIYVSIMQSFLIMFKIKELEMSTGTKNLFDRLFAQLEQIHKDYNYLGGC